MSRVSKILFSLTLLLLTALAAGCGPLLTPVQPTGAAPTPVVQVESAATDDPNVYVDHEPFQAALLQAIQDRDEARLARWMAEPFYSGWWRGELGIQPPADALRELYQDQLGGSIQLGSAPGVDLAALLGGINPLEILPPEANVVNAVVVTGWGKDGADEAILFVARRPNNALAWAGTLVIQGGFTSPETGGVALFANPQHGYQAYLPIGYEAVQTSPGGYAILAPQGTEGHRERAFITVEPANGRTVEQVMADFQAQQIPEIAEQLPTALGLDTEMALVVDRVPSQEFMRVLFVVHEDRLYQMIFIPQDETRGAAYNQMRRVYAAVANTFQFIPLESAGPGTGEE